ncbi:MAG: hypothetical protein B7C24_17320, partial [Bacteroidetes bacterium 4572_77]
MNNSKNIKSKVFADFGNTRAKFLVDDEIISIYNKDLNYNTLLPILKDRDLFYGSVNQKTDQIIHDYFSCTNIKTLLDREKSIRFKHISGIGTDRVLSLLGGSLFFQPPLITIECGTCNTINILDDNYKILGGSIAPGMLTMFDSMEQINPALKANLPEHQKEKGIQIGTNTSDALISGVMATMIGGIAYYLDMICKDIENSGKEIPIILTGGSG